MSDEPVDVEGPQSRRNAYEKVLAILRAVEDGPLDGSSLAEISQRTGEIPSTCLRILETLKADNRVMAIVRPGDPASARRWIPGERACLKSWLLQLNERARLAVCESQAAQDLVHQALGVLEDVSRRGGNGKENDD